MKQLIISFFLIVLVNQVTLTLLKSKIKNSVLNCDYFFENRCFRKATDMSNIKIGTKFLLRQEYIVNGNSQVFPYSQFGVQYLTFDTHGNGLGVLPDGFINGSTTPAPINPRSEMVMIFLPDSVTGRNGWFWENNNQPVYFNNKFWCNEHFNDLVISIVPETSYFTMKIKKFCGRDLSGKIYVLNAGWAGCVVDDYDTLDPKAYYFSIFQELVCDYYFEGRCFRKATNMSNISIGTKIIIRQEYIVTPNKAVFTYSQLAAQNLGRSAWGLGISVIPDAFTYGSTTPAPIKARSALVMVYQADLTTGRNGWFWESNPTQAVYFNNKVWCGMHFNEIQFNIVTGTSYFNLRLLNFCGTSVYQNLYVLNALWPGYVADDPTLDHKSYYFSIFKEETG